MSVLLDANVLIALAVPSHVHHDRADQWLASADFTYATCPMTQGALMRLMVREDGTPERGVDLLAAIAQAPRHEFWPDQLPFTAVRWAGTIGHRQVTDAYLAELAREHRSQLATFDQGLASLHQDVALLVPT